MRKNNEKLHLGQTLVTKKSITKVYWLDLRNQKHLQSSEIFPVWNLDDANVKFMDRNSKHPVLYAE